MIQNSTISGNTASGEGGAMWFGGYYGLELTQSTITGNTASTIGGVALYGTEAAAAAHGGPRPKAQDVKPEKDKSDKDGGSSKGQAKSQARKASGGGAHAQADGEVSATGTILWGNVGEDIGTNGNPGAVLTSDHSLLGVVGDGVTVTDTGGTLTGVDPLVGPLQNNGGPTETHALLAGSPAINTGSQPGAELPDQRVRPARSRVRPSRRWCGRHRCVRGAAAADARADRHHAQVHRLSRRSGPASGPER